MQEQHQKIVYSAILRKKHTILTEFTDCSGNFSQITKGIMDEVINVKEDEPIKYKAKFFYGKYTFHILKDNKIYILTMTKPQKVPLDNENLFFNFLFSVHKDISKLINFENPGKLRAYSLSSYFNDLKVKVTQFNEGEIKFNNKLINEQNDINKYEVLDDKIFNEYKHFPILSNEQVHSDNNLQKDVTFDTTVNNCETVDSFNDDILKSYLIADFPKKEAINDDEPIPMKPINNTGDFDFNFKEKKRKKWWPRIIILIVLILIILVVLDIFVFHKFIKI